MKNFVLGLFSIVLVLPGICFAQRHEGHGGRSDRHESIGSTIRDCERRTDEFKVELRRYLETSKISGTERERDLNRDARSLEHALNRVREGWEAERRIERITEHLDRALRAAQDLNRTMIRHKMSGDLQRIWHGVRRDLNRLADVCDRPKLRWED